MHEVEAVGARGAGEAIDVGDVGRAGKVVRGGVEGARKSNIVKASTPAILAAIKALNFPYLNVPSSKVAWEAHAATSLSSHIDHHAALGDYSTDIVVLAKERLPGLRIVSTSNLAAEIVELTTCADDIPGSTVGQPKHIQYLRPEYSPSSFHVSAH
jgi:hypothetical protein